MDGSEAKHRDLEPLRRVWEAAPPSPDLRAFLTPESLADESLLRALIHLDALERHRLGEDAGLEHYRSVLPADFTPDPLAPGSELARLLIRLELLMHGDAAGADRLESLRQRLGDDYAADVSIAARGAAPSMASPIAGRTVAPDDVETEIDSPGIVGAHLPRGERLGDWIGPYRLLDVIGEGGFGIVYHAEQRAPIERHVALKLIKPGMDTKSVLARFEAERQTLALLRHDHIAAIYDAGATERGRPYFVMELVRGEPITRYCDRHRLTTRERLELFIPVCRAVHHAHQKGIIHRDLSPDNILVEVRDGRPIPKVIDFGVAKAIDRRMTEHTLSIERGVMIGKPEYMSPEQAEMTNLDIDTTADIYSLGVILYEMLAGVLPLDRKTLRRHAIDEMVRLIRFSDRLTPQTRLSSLDHETAQEIAFFRQVELRTLAKELGGRLQYLPMKALRADRTKRFSSAEALARDVEHYLADQDFDEAAVEPRMDRVKRFMRRNRGPVTAAALLFVALVLGIGGTTWQAVRATRAEAAIEQERDALARARADTQRFADFQAEQLSNVNVDLMGARLREDLLNRRRAALESKGLDDDDIAAVLADFEANLVEVNFVDLALHAMDVSILSETIDAIALRFADDIRIRARLLSKIANTMHQIGLLNRALDVQREVFDLVRVELGDDHEDTITARSGLGLLLLYLGPFDEAMEHIEAAYEIGSRKHGEEHEATLVARHNLAQLRIRQGRYNEAEVHLRATLTASRVVLGDEHPHTLLALQLLAVVMSSQGRYDEAETYLRDALALARRVLGNEHRDTLNAINSIGYVVDQLGRRDEAEGYYYKALELSRRVLGDEHPLTMTAMSNIGVRHYYQGRNEDAERLFRQVYEQRNRIFGRGHPDVKISATNLAAIIHRLAESDYQAGHYEVAISQFREAMQIMLESFGREHEDVRRIGENLGHALVSHGRSLVDMGKFPEAEPSLGEAFECFERYGGPTDMAARSLIELYSAWHDHSPSDGHDLRAEEWRARVAAIQEGGRDAEAESDG